MKKFERQDPKLFKASGFYVKDFYLIATDEEDAAQRAKTALTFQVRECKIEESGVAFTLSDFWKQLRGK